MSRDPRHFEALCDRELAAADEAALADERIRHLEQAFLFAQEAARLRRTGFGDMHDPSSEHVSSIRPGEGRAECSVKHLVLVER